MAGQTHNRAQPVRPCRDANVCAVKRRRGTASVNNEANEKDEQRQPPRREEQPEVMGEQQPQRKEEQDAAGGDRVRVEPCQRPGSSGDSLSQEVAAGTGDMDHGRMDEGEDGRRPRGLRAPFVVSKEERELHELTHTPYRAWCPHCVRARGRNTPHRSRNEELQQGEVPRIALDYFFMSTVDEAAHSNPLIVMVDEATGDKYARAVGRKGAGVAGELDWVVKDMSDELKSWGHTGGQSGHIVLKSDGEPSIVALREALAKYHGGRVVQESSAKGESASNGAVEVAGRTVREFVRVLKEQVEHLSGVQLECAGNLTQWMVRWAAMLCSRYLVGQDGLTAYERRRGRRCRMPVVIFGEKVWFKEIRAGKERKDKFQSEWLEGIWLGHSRSANEHIIGAQEGVVRAYAIKRQDADSRWCTEMLEQLKGTPQQPDPSRPGLAVPVRVNFDAPADVAPLEANLAAPSRQIRRMKITARMLAKYGFTEGCEGCRYKQAGLDESRNHSEACRTRIEEAMEEDEEGKRNKEAQGERITRRLAERIEQADTEEGPLRSRATRGSMAPSAQGGGSFPEAMDVEFGEAPVEEESHLEQPEVLLDSPAGRVENLQPGLAERGSGSGKSTPGIDSGNAMGGGSPRSRSRSRSPLRDGASAGHSGVKHGVESTSADGHSPKRRRGNDRDEEMDEDAVEEMLQSVQQLLSVQLNKLGLQQSDVLDLTTGWDFTQTEQRSAVMQSIEKHSPKLIVGSSMCAHAGVDQQRWSERLQHTQFLMQVYRRQHLQGWWYLHEQPAAASLQSLQAVTGEMKDYGAMTLRTCGAQAALPCGRGYTGPLSPTTFVTNCGRVNERLINSPAGPCTRSCTMRAPQCVERHVHGMRYSDAISDAICKGLAEEAEWRKQHIRKLVDVRPSTQTSWTTQEEEEESSWRVAWDDVSGQELDPAEVSKARAKEMGYVHEKGVWKLIPRAEAISRGWSIVPTRWIDINKGDCDNPNYRSRLVAKEFRTGDQDGIFAATPPLEALRLLISEAATQESDACPENVIMINDVARAFFEAPARRAVCIELPAEAAKDTQDDMVGFLQKSLYGTRDAAANFQEEVRLVMEKAGFKQSAYSPSVYFHPQRNIMTLVHGDDFITVGKREQVLWFRGVLECRFELKTKIIGAGAGEAQEARVLNRVIRVTSSGWEYEADQRHGELVVKGLHLDGAKGVKSPGEDERPWEAEKNGEHLCGSDVSTYRALAARANYLALDRADIQYAAKEICRGMARPTKGDLKRLKRLARYLIEVPRSVWRFDFQRPVDVLSIYSDSDFAGCSRTARSTSGGIAMRGSHCLRSWSVTQNFVTLSSAEAELMAAVRATSEGIGLTQLCHSWGLSATARIFVDSSAALAVVSRNGNGKLRHVRVGHLWIQELAAREEVAFTKVRGTDNPADLCTKHLSAGARQRLCDAISLETRGGRADASLVLSRLGRSNAIELGAVSADGDSPLGRGGVFACDTCQDTIPLHSAPCSVNVGCPQLSRYDLRSKYAQPAE